MKFKLFKYDPNFREEFSILNLLKLFRLKLKLILIIIISFLLLLTIYSYIIPEEYSAHATLLPPDDASSPSGLTSFLQSLSGGISIGGIAQSNKIQMFEEYLKSREVAKKIVDTLKIRSKPDFNQLSDDILFDVVGSFLEVEIKRSGLIIISSKVKTGYLPDAKDKEEAKKFAADIANASIACLDVLIREKSTSKARKKRIFIERMLAEKQNKLDSVDNMLLKFRETNKVLEIDEQSQAILNTAISIGSELAKAELELKLKMQEFEQNSPLLKPYKDKLANLSAQYSRVQRGGLVSGDAFSIPLNEVPQLIKQYTNLIREQKILEQVKLYLETQRYQEAIQEESDIPVVEALDKATPPLLRTSPNRKVMIIFGFVIISFFTLTGVTLWAIIKGKILLKKEENLTS